MVNFELKNNSALRVGIFVTLLVLTLCSGTKSFAQTLYVDAANGKDGAKGTIDTPLANLEEAVKLTHNFKGDQPVIIKVNPGLYILKDQLLLKTASISNDTIAYKIEAMVMPDDKEWKVDKMPVIQSVSGINDTIGFRHCIGISVLKNNVSIKGIKFLGNPNTEVKTYYPIRRADKSLDGLFVSQCFFIGEKNSTAIQSAFWVSGSGIQVDHCIFNSCKIAMVLGSRLDHFSLSYSIINDAYNTAIWYGFSGTVKPFVLKNNIITNSNYVMVYPKENGQPEYTIKDSYFVSNENYLGSYPKSQEYFVKEKVSKIKEVNILKTGKIKLVDVKNNGLTKDNLNLTADSDGKNIGAGLFK